jgi:hypothetical protein
MKKPNLFLHIGAHKTGTSYIQKVFSDNIEFLEQNNVIYPEKWKGILWGHHELVLELCSDNYCDGELQEFVKNSPKESTIIISSENFESINPTAINKLKCLNEIANVKVIYFHRHFQDLAYSLWQESIKHGDYLTFSRFLFDNYSAPYQSQNINFYPKLKPYIDVFGSDNIEVVNYNKLRDDNADVAHFFLKNVCCLADFPFNSLVISDSRINSSFSCEIIECIRVLNLLFFKKYNKQPSSDLRENFMKLLHSGKINLSDIEFSYDDNYSLYNKNVPIDLVSKEIYSNFNDKHNHFRHTLKDHQTLSVASADTWLCKENNEVLSEYFGLVDA